MDLEMDERAEQCAPAAKAFHLITGSPPNQQSNPAAACPRGNCARFDTEPSLTVLVSRHPRPGTGRMHNDDVLITGTRTSTSLGNRRAAVPEPLRLQHQGERPWLIPCRRRRPPCW